VVASSERGLAPGLGEPCDITDAGVSAAEGDWGGAALSAVSAVPFVGYAGASGKAAKLVNKYNDLRKSTGKPVIGFAPGEGVTALTDNRLQHGTKHLTKAGLLPNWSGKTSPALIRSRLSPILENPRVTVDHELGGAPVKGLFG